MSDTNSQSGDLLLWLAAGVIACMGLVWLVIEAPWSTPEPLDEPTAAAPTAIDSATTAAAVREPAPTEAVPLAAAESAASSNSESMQLALLALEAGMLIEPPDYSAWALFGEIVAAEPDNEAALEGLQNVAEALTARGRTALEQGRYADANTLAGTIIERLPDYAPAQQLAAAAALAMRPPPPPEPEPEPVAEEAVAEVEPIDPIPAMHESFFAAMAANSVLTPPGASAVDIIRQMQATDPDHELTTAARDMLVTEMLDRSAQSIDARDTAAAQTWIDAAAPLAADRTVVARAQDRLTQHLIDMESQKLLPASAFTMTRNAAPEYPRMALNRGLEGWVDVEFVITTAGETADIEVIDASHDRYFREEAVMAVEEWRFEPDTFMDQPISRRSFTRLAFVLD